MDTNIQESVSFTSPHWENGRCLLHGCPSTLSCPCPICLGKRDEDVQVVLSAKLFTSWMNHPDFVDELPMVFSDENQGAALVAQDMLRRDIPLILDPTSGEPGMPGFCKWQLA